MPLILGTNSIKETGFDVANSCRFEASSSDYMHKTPSSAGNRQKWTFSFWTKVAGNFNYYAFSSGTAATDRTYIYFNDSALGVQNRIDSSNVLNLITNAVHRDVAAWYNFVVAIDTTQGTAANRAKCYVNGTQITSFETETYPDQNVNTFVNNTQLHTVGKPSWTDSAYYDGYMAEVVHIDGQQLDPTSFGEFDEDSGIWKPINVSGLTFGTNGFYLDFKDSANLGNDANGGTDFTEVNLAAIDQSTDTCTNNFCTINVLDNESGNITITEGNLNYTSTGGTDETNRCTFGFTKGKWYFESKYINDANYIDVGVGSASDSDIATPRFHMEMAGYYMLQSFTSYTKVWDNGSLIATLAASAENDIHMYAIDMDNNRFYAGKNGSWYSSGDPANNSNPLISMDNGYTTLMPSVCTKGDGAASLNFGSPSYSESGGETDGDGYGNFAHAVPSGYYAINTKNLAEYG